MHFTLDTFSLFCLPRAEMSSWDRLSCPAMRWEGTDTSSAFWKDATAVRQCRLRCKYQKRGCSLDFVILRAI